ncbi:MAG: hypothetical protein C5B55_12400 [Blastocatellia bacterium]|nr:MAG: hypothetical protein C5B55_12400 [Blastocatellia bacterium]
MSGNEQRDGRKLAYAGAGTALYVYCIAETGAAREVIKDATLSALEDGTKVNIVERDSISAVVSSVPLTDYGEDQLTNNLSDATWLAPRAMRHEQVVEHFAKRTSVVPLRFGTVYLNQRGIEGMLSAKHQELMNIIERLRGREEWGVNIYFDRTQLLQTITSVSPKLRELASQAQEAAPGQSYLLRKKIDSLRVDEVRTEMTRLIDETEKRLLASSDEVRRLRVLKVESTEHGELKAKFAVLIKRSAYEDFHSSVERWAVENQQSGMRLELTGPWPAYNFTDEKSA